MQIILNGQPYDIAPDSTAADLVVALELQGRRLAMEINEEIVPRSAYAEHRLDAGDRVEIVHAIGGG